jgi:hypothetical protein
MRANRITRPFYVIKAQDLHVLNHMGRDFPRPQHLEWINRARNTRLQRTALEMLVRTLFRDTKTASVRRLHEEAGLRVTFTSEEDRHKFAKLFREALAASETEACAIGRSQA